MTARLHRLPNGFTVAVDPMPGVESLAVGLYADVGARSEPAPLAGLAHMVEHMVFKGTEGRDARAIAEAVEDVGGSLNAWTGREQTVFHARLLAADLALGVDLVADFVRAARFDADELEQEKDVVLSELGEARDTPDDIIFDNLNGAAFPKQPLGSPVLGTEASIAAIAAPDLHAWIADQYRPSGLILAAAGKVDEDALLKLAESRFGDLPPGAPPAFAPATFASGTHRDSRRFDQVHLAFAHPGLPADHPDGHALGMFSQAAGGGMSSRLFQQLREERGLAYSIYSWANGYADTGMFGVYCAADHARAAQAQALAHDVLAAVATDVTDEEVERARAQMKAGLLMGLESVQARCDHLARMIQLKGRVVTPTELTRDIDGVTRADVLRVGAQVLSGPRATATVGGKLARVA